MSLCVCDPAAKDLIARMLHVDTTRRLRVGEVLDHPWIKVGGAAGRHALCGWMKVLIGCAPSVGV